MHQLEADIRYDVLDIGFITIGWLICIALTQNNGKGAR